MLKRLMILFLAVAVFILASSLVSAQNIYYISTNGNDTTGDGSYDNPWVTLHKAFQEMQGGDTLVLKDGVYTGEDNVIDHWHYPPDGTSDAYTIIKAENDGEVIFDGENVRQMFSLHGSWTYDQKYLQFEGIAWRNSPGTLVRLTFTDHIKFLRCGIYDAGGSGQCCDGFGVSHSSYILYEDCWSYGASRKNFYVGKFAEKVILRRCVVRHDRHFLYSDQDSFMPYDAKEVEFQNCISIDGDQYDYYTGNDGNFNSPKSWCARNTTDGYALSDVYFRGCISIGNDAMRGGCGSGSCGVQFIDCIHWDSFYGTRMRGAGGSFDHCTFGNITGDTTWSPACYLEMNSDSITNSLIYGVINYYALWGGLGNDYNSLYGNQNNYRAVSAGPHDLCSENSNEIDPMDGNPGNGISALRYLPRIEDSSDLDAAASDGGDVGATIMKKIGRSGTLWGEEGYNEITNESLWPWPYENIIKEKMKAYSYDNGNLRGDRGFAASGNGLYGGPITLTSYIWEYLGSPCPSEICTYGTPQNCSGVGGTCKTNPCSTYQDCSSLAGACATGYCCSGNCTTPCVENWQCTAWSECVDDQQTRTCTDLNSCGTTHDKPVEVQSCMMPGTAFTYTFEAEDGQLTLPMEIGLDESASGGSYVYCPVSDDGVVEYTIDIPVAGEYIIWGRVIAPSDDKDSFFIGDASASNVWDVLYEGQLSEWTWDQVTQRGSGSFDNPEFDPRVFNLNVEQFTLTIISRERDTLLDKLIVTNNLSFSPVEEIVVCLDSDGDGFNVSQAGCGVADCDDVDTEVFPGATELCNNMDDDCDDSVDENLVRQCGSSDVGACQYGTQACSEGSWLACQGNIEPTDEICGNGIDEDCSGSDLECPPGGVCSDGTPPFQCSTKKPLYCEFNETLRFNCQTCGCDQDEMCQPDGTCVYQEPDDLDSDGVPNSLDKCLFTPLNLSNYVNAFGCVVPKYEEFDKEESTNLTSVNPNNVTNFTLTIKNKGRIIFQNSTNLSRENYRLDLDKHVDIEHARILVNTTALSMLNKTTVLIMYNITLVNPLILKDSQLCQNCQLISYGNQTLTFKVTSLSTFELIEGPYCGNTVCDSGETCTTCSADCGSCPTPTPPSTGGGGGGGGGGGYRPPTPTPKACEENWQCTIWTACTQSNEQTRTCIDLNNCNTTNDKPEIVQSCVYVHTEEEIQELKEEAHEKFMNETLPKVQEKIEVEKKKATSYWIFTVVIATVAMLVFIAVEVAKSEKLKGLRELKQHIIQAKKAGMTKRQIRQELLRAGWPEKTIEKVLK